MIPRISRAIFPLSQAETLHPSVPAHCQYSSRFTTVSKPILSTSPLLFVKQYLIQTRGAVGMVGGGGLVPLRTLDSPESSHLSCLKFTEWKNNTKMHNRTVKSRIWEGSVCFFFLQLTVNCSWNPFSYGAMRNAYNKSDRQVASGFHFLQSRRRERESGRFIL